MVRNMTAEYASLAQQMPHVSFGKLSGEASPKNQQLFTSAGIFSFPLCTYTPTSIV
jgi:hypothetical protein